MKKNNQTLIKGAMLLTVAGLIAKVLSAFYRIPLVHLVNTDNMGYYTTAYPFYAILTATGLVGIPNAMSKIIAEKIALGQYKQANRTFKDALIFASLLGVIVSSLIFFGADWFIKLFNWYPETKYVLFGFGIAPVFISISGVIRGYFQGMQIMRPTAYTQVIENFVKVVVGVSLVYAFIQMGKSIPEAVAGAAIGASCGAIISAIFMIISYRLKRKTIIENIKLDLSKPVKTSNKEIISKIVSTAIPITIVATAYSIKDFIDTLTIYPGLGKLGYDSNNILEIVGRLGNANSVINFPLTISVALSVAIVPAIANAAANKDMRNVANRMQQVTRLGLITSLPAAAGLIVLARPIFILLYPSANGYRFLQLLAIALIFMILGQSLAGVLQGLSKQYIALISLGIAIIFKIIFNLLLIPTSLEGSGAPVSTIIYYIVFVMINYMWIKKIVTFKLNISHTILKPLGAAIIMGITVFFAYNGLYQLTNSNAISTMLTVCLGGMIYIGVLLLIKGITKEDLQNLPKTEKIIGFLEKNNLIKE